jgi:uncharacterized protein YbjT (DUF2867 family)
MIFVTGATGYMGSRLVRELVARGKQVRALARRDADLPSEVVRGDALDGESYAGAVRGCEQFVHLIGVAHPAPWKEAQFRAIDLVSLREAVKAATRVAVDHFVYVSVAHPAPSMKAYIRVRMECEQIIRDSGLNATILRPWYVLGPGHQWPHVLRPFYWIAEQIPATREGALRLGLVTIDQMQAALVRAVENPASAVRVWQVPDIRASLAEVRNYVDQRLTEPRP